MNINEKINLRGAIESWAHNTLAAQGKSIDKRGLSRSGAMRNQRTVTVQGLNNGSYRITFTVKIYAMFLDMAVSKGHPLGARAKFMANRQIERALGQRYTKQPKLYKNQFWLNKVMYGRTLDLAKINANIWGNEFLQLQIPQRIEFSL